VRAGVTQHPRSWRWSSYQATAGLIEGPSSLSPDRLLELLGPSREAAGHRFVSAVELALGRDCIR
jgi:hypothetical protein